MTLPKSSMTNIIVHFDYKYQAAEWIKHMLSQGYKLEKKPFRSAVGTWVCEVVRVIN